MKLLDFLYIAGVVGLVIALVAAAVVLFGSGAWVAGIIVSCWAVSAVYFGFKFYRHRLF